MHHLISQNQFEILGFNTFNAGSRYHSDTEFVARIVQQSSESQRKWTEKGSMNVNGVEKTEMNVVSLFGSVQEENIPDPLEALLQETEEILLEETMKEEPQRLMVSETQFPDQSMFTLDQQLVSLKESINRMKFYLLDLDDLLPK